MSLKVIDGTDECKNVKQSQNLGLCLAVILHSCLSTSPSTFFQTLLPAALDVGADALA